jgi:S1-C subfamily serine protease
MGIDMDGYVPADVVAEDRDSDVALLRVGPRALKRPRPVQRHGCAALANGAQTYVLGIRADAEPKAFELGVVRGTALDRANRIKELLAEPARRSRTWVAVSQQIQHGYSGGPILDGTGCLVGLIVGAPEMSGRWSEFSYGADAISLAQLLDSARVSRAVIPREAGR